MKEYRQVPAAVELVGYKKARVSARLQTEGCCPQRSPVEQPQPRCRRSAKWVLEDDTAWYGQEKKWVNIAVCPYLQSSLTQHRNINPFENNVLEIHIFIKNCVRSFIDIRHYLWLFPLIYVYVCGNTTYRPTAVVYTFYLVVLPLIIHMKGTTGVYP